MDKNTLHKYEEAIISYAKGNYSAQLREPAGILKHGFIVPGSYYSTQLWDWDSWLTNIALRRIAPPEALSGYEKGCVLNFIENMCDDGRMSICLTGDGKMKLFEDMKNIHKPCIAQHALFISEQDGSFEWLREYFPRLSLFLSYYEEHCKHESGLYFWLDDGAIGVDNDPCTFYRPHGSSASIYLNCLMYMELSAMAKIAHALGLSDESAHYSELQQALLYAIREHCWDERDGFYYSVDINLLPIDKNEVLHSGAPRHWSCLIQRIGVWSGFMAMWAGIATPEQAERMVREHYLNDSTFHAEYGVRSLSRAEKMYRVVTSGNPSCWLGPIWGVANYMTFEGLCRYGYTAEARDLAEKTVTLFGRDVLECGEFHEYYDPDTGRGVNNQGFQSWNLLAVNMIEWLRNITNDGFKTL